jgi:hypothetical protein
MLHFYEILTVLRETVNNYSVRGWRLHVKAMLSGEVKTVLSAKQASYHILQPPFAFW